MLAIVSVTTPARATGLSIASATPASPSHMDVDRSRQSEASERSTPLHSAESMYRSSRRQPSGSSSSSGDARAPGAPGVPGLPGLLKGGLGAAVARL